MKISNVVGKLGEDLATEYLRKKGYKIIERNFRKGYGELDIIATDSNVLVCVEVKTRTVGVDKFGKGVESVNIYKQQKLLRAVKMYLLKKPKMLNFKPQIDVCLLEYNEFDKSFKPAIIIPNAVEDWS